MSWTSKSDPCRLHLQEQQLIGIKGSAAKIFVPDTTGHLQLSFRVHALMGQSCFGSNRGNQPGVRQVVLILRLKHLCMFSTDCLIVAGSCTKRTANCFLALIDSVYCRTLRKAIISKQSIKELLISVVRLLKKKSIKIWFLTLDGAVVP